MGCPKSNFRPMLTTTDSTERVHWITAVSQVAVAGHGGRRLLSLLFAMVVCSLPWLFCLSLLARGEPVETAAAAGYASISLWISLAPWLIWRYDSRTLPRFLRRLRMVPGVMSENAERLGRQHCRSFRTTSIALSVIWTAIGLAVWYGTTCWVSGIGLHGPRDPLYWLAGVLASWAGYLCGIGCAGVVAMVRTMKDASTMQVHLEPLHCDGHGGLGFFGDCAIQTTGLFGSGLLFFPILIFGVASASNLRVWVYVLIAIFTAFVLASFLYPTYLVYRKSKDLRADAVSAISKTYRALADQLTQRLEGATESLANHYDELERLRRERRDALDVRAWPFQPTLLTAVLVQAAAPFIMLILKRLFGAP